MTLVRLKPAASRSRAKHSTTEPLRSQVLFAVVPKVAVLRFEVLSIAVSVKIPVVLLAPSLAGMTGVG